ncbi:MAG: twin-arginine translocation signal domain-containing protein [Actinomycetota bacterium]
MSDKPLDQHVSRRSALKKAAVVGGALWVTPAIQSVNMTKAWASVGSLGTDPCYSVDIDVNLHGGVSYDTDAGFRCLSPKGTWGGPYLIVATSDGAGGWIITVGNPGARVAEGYAKARDTDADAGCNPGTLTATNAMRFAATTDPSGKPVKVRDIELTFCIPAPK